MVDKSKPELEAAGYMTSDRRKRAMDKTAACRSAAQYICLCSSGSLPREMEPLPVTWLPHLNNRNQDNPPRGMPRAFPGHARFCQIQNTDHQSLCYNFSHLVIKPPFGRILMLLINKIYKIFLQRAYGE